MALVQTVSATNSGAGTATATFTASPSYGNLLVFVVAYRSGTTVITPSPLGMEEGPTNDDGMYNVVTVYTQVVPAAAPLSYAFTVNSDYCNVVVFEYSGRNSANQFDGTPVWAYELEATQVPTATSVTTTRAGDDAINLAVVNDTTDANITASNSPWSSMQSVGGEFHPIFWATQDSVSISATLTSNWTGSP